MNVILSEEVISRKYGLLPEITETVIEDLMKEISEFMEYMRISPEKLRRTF